MRSTFLLVLLALLSTLIASGQLHSQSAASPIASPSLLPGDIVRITVWRQPALSGEFPIAADGSIVHPLFRDVQVVGVGLDEVESQLRAVLSRYEASPQFVVQPLMRVAVGGEVRLPSLYSLEPETTIAQAVALAGGLSERGRMDRVTLIRRGESIVIDLVGDAAAAGQTVQSGDQIFVSRRRDIFREYIAPAGSITGAAVSVISLLLRETRR